MSQGLNITAENNCDASNFLSHNGSDVSKKRNYVCKKSYWSAMTLSWLLFPCAVKYQSGNLFSTQLSMLDKYLNKISIA